MDFAIGGVSAMCANVFTNPMDVIKTRQQLQGELIRNANSKQLPYKGMWQAVKSIVAAEGLRGLQKGFGPAISYQFVHNSTRLGLFQTVDSLKWMSWSGSDRHSPFLLVFWGAVTGIVGAAVGSPLYMIKTQIQSQSHGKFAVGYQHQHTGTISALTSTYRSSGVKGLFRGVIGSFPRAAVGSAIQLATFTKCKDFFSDIEFFKQSTFLTAAGASMVSGGFVAIGMTPFDVICTRLFNQGVDAKGKGLLYRNFFDCLFKTFRYEGVRGLYKGFVAIYWRVAPHTILNLTFWDQLKKLNDLYMVDKKRIV